MIDLYTWTTPNGYKISIALEELGLDYTTHMVNIGDGEQHEQDFLALNPNGKIPAMVDRDGAGEQARTLFESGAILWYLAEKTGQLMGGSETEKYAALQWLFFQNAGVGPMMGQLGHFRGADEEIPYALERYTSETKRLLSVLEGHLSQNAFLAGESYTVADISTYPWVSMADKLGVEPRDFPAVEKWVERIGSRESVASGKAVLDEAKAANARG